MSVIELFDREDERGGEKRGRRKGGKTRSSLLIVEKRKHSDKVDCRLTVKTLFDRERAGRSRQQ